jgi:alpha-1,3-rhamnosyl/mannosyltransferase
MRVVIGGDSLYGPLTGIGQYTQALTTKLLGNPAVSELQLLALGRLHRPEALLPAPAAQESEQPVPNPFDVAASEAHSAGRAGSPPAGGSRWLGNFRSLAAKNKLAIAAYQRLMPLAERRLLRHFGPRDVFHSPNYLLPPFPGRRVVSILDLSTLRFPEFHPAARVALVNHHIQLAVRHADVIITISNLVREELLDQFKLAPERVRVTYLAADPRFKPLSATSWASQVQGAKEQVPPYRGYFLSMSTLEPRKNISRLLDAYLAYREVVDEEPLPLYLAGTSGWKSEEVQKRLSELANSGFVRYLGYVPQQSLPLLVAGARALLFPSLYEGFGLPVLEAMQSGTPVLSSRASAMEEFAGDALMAVDPRATEAMTAALVRLHRDLTLTDRLARAGVARAAEFSWERCAKETFNAYAGG